MANSISLSQQHPLNERDLLDQVAESYKKILQNKLVGIYVHGSMAFGCFNWDKSDIDFLVVTNEIPTQNEKISMIQKIIDLYPASPPKGLEMSVILEKYCNKFIYPTPYELHYSNDHLTAIKKDINQYCQKMHGNDKDLAAHFIVVKAVGYTLCGKDLHQVFTGEVPKSDYLDSIILDIKNSKEEIKEAIENKDNQSIIYITLNLCRVLAFIRDDIVVSKENGGIWGTKNLPQKFLPVIDAALKSYKSKQTVFPDFSLLDEFVQFMINQIIPE